MVEAVLCGKSALVQCWRAIKSIPVEDKEENSVRIVAYAAIQNPNEYLTPKLNK